MKDHLKLTGQPMEGVSSGDMGFMLRAVEPVEPPRMLLPAAPPTKERQQRQADIRNVGFRNRASPLEIHGHVTPQQKAAASIEARLQKRRLENVAAWNRA